MEILNKIVNKIVKKIINESIEQVDDNNLIIKAGTELFHGTIEKFNKDEVRPGGYDGIFWTTNNSLISQSYIPVAGSIIYTSSESIGMPSDNPTIQLFQKQLGIEYDYSQIEFSSGHKAKSFKIAPIFKDIYNKRDEIYKEYQNLKDQYDKLYNDYQNSNFEKSDEKRNVLKTLSDLKNKFEESKTKYFEFEVNKQINNYVNQELHKLGYESDGDDFNNNSFWKLKYNENRLQPKDYRATGRLLIITPKRDLKIYDTTLGGKIEGDLTDLDYHKHSWFQQVKDSGYDGIKINDFAQSNDQGNFGHHSIGLFQHVLKDVQIQETPAIHHDFGEYNRGNDWDSPEYKKFKSLSENIFRRVSKRILKENSDMIFNRQIKAELAQAAQEVYDGWLQNDEGYDEMLGSGGICQDIADSMCEILSKHNIDCVTFSQETGEQHVYVIARIPESGIYSVDIPPGLYETGGGYNWKKIPDIEFDERYIYISKLTSDAEDENFSDLFGD